MALVICASDERHAVSRAAFRGAPVSSVLFMNTVKLTESDHPLVPVAKRQFSATHVVVFRNGSTRCRSGNEKQF